MKQFLSWFGKKAMGGIVTALFFILAVLGIVYALNYPSTPPEGEVVGGKFMTYFNKMLVNTGVTTDGTVHKSLTTEQIGTLTDGKWCKVVSGKIICNQSAPGSGLGDGQIWQDVKASRSANTWYINNTGRSISVAIYYYDIPAVGDGAFTVSPDWWATSMQLSYFESNHIHASFDHIIPHGWSYKFSGTAGTWYELR